MCCKTSFINVSGQYTWFCRVCRVSVLKDINVEPWFDFEECAKIGQEKDQ